VHTLTAVIVVITSQQRGHRRRRRISHEKYTRVAIVAPPRTRFPTTDCINIYLVGGSPAGRTYTRARHYSAITDDTDASERSAPYQTPSNIGRSVTIKFDDAIIRRTALTAVDRANDR